MSGELELLVTNKRSCLEGLQWHPVRNCCDILWEIVDFFCVLYMGEDRFWTKISHFRRSGSQECSLWFGFRIRNLQRFWEILEDVMMAFLKKFHGWGRCIRSLVLTLLSWFPKRMAPSIRNYQPISLMGSAFNFLARVLGNQLFSFFHIGWIRCFCWNSPNFR